MKNFLKTPTFKKALKDTVPVMAGYIVLGIGFGILLAQKGYAFWWSTFSALSIYAGSMQYVQIDLLATMATFAQIALMTLLVNARHVFYGLSLIEKYNSAGKYRPYLIFSLTDETYSLVSTVDLPQGYDENKYFFYVSILDQFYWVLGCTIGGILGNTVTFNSAGIDFAMTALFITIFTDTWLKNKNHTNAIIGVVSTFVCLMIFGAKNFLIPAMVLILVLLFALKPFMEKGDVK